MSRYRARVGEIEAAPSPIWAGEMEVILGQEVFHLDAVAFHLIFERVEDPRAMVVVPVVVVLPVSVAPPPAPAPVPGLPTSERWSTTGEHALPDPPPAPKALGKGHSKYYGGSWVCESGHLVTGGRKCPSCGATNPKLINRTAMRRV